MVIFSDNILGCIRLECAPGNECRDFGSFKVVFDVDVITNIVFRERMLGIA